MNKNNSNLNSLSKEDCKKFADSVGASYADNGIWKNGSSTSKKMANGCLYWRDSGGPTVRYNSVGTGSCDNPHFNYVCIKNENETKTKGYVEDQEMIMVDIVSKIQELQKNNVQIIVKIHQVV